MAQPSALPRWASTVVGNTTYIVDPSSGLKDTGWGAGVQPSAQHLNWYMELVYEWINYLKGEVTGGTIQLQAMEAVLAVPLGSSWQLSKTGSDWFGIESTNGTGYSAIMPIPIRQGCTITAARVRIHIDAGNTGASEVSARLVRVNGTSAGTVTAWSATNSASGAGDKTLALTGTALLIDTLNSAYIEITALHSLHSVYSAEVDWTRP